MQQDPLAAVAVEREDLYPRPRPAKSDAGTWKISQGRVLAGGIGGPMLPNCPTTMRMHQHTLLALRSLLQIQCTKYANAKVSTYYTTK